MHLRAPGIRQSRTLFYGGVLAPAFSVAKGGRRENRLATQVYGTSSTARGITGFLLMPLPYFSPLFFWLWGPEELGGYFSILVWTRKLVENVENRIWQENGTPFFGEIESCRWYFCNVGCFAMSFAWNSGKSIYWFKGNFVFFFSTIGCLWLWKLLIWGTCDFENLGFLNLLI